MRPNKQVAALSSEEGTAPIRTHGKRTGLFCACSVNTTRWQGYPQMAACTWANDSCSAHTHMPHTQMLPLVIPRRTLNTYQPADANSLTLACRGHLHICTPVSRHQCEVQITMAPQRKGLSEYDCSSRQGPPRPQMYVPRMSQLGPPVHGV